MSNYIIKYNNVEFPVNPEIFAEKSETFRHYYNPEQTMTITGERSVDCFKQLLPYVQGVEPNITPDNIDEIESFADEWDVQSLRDSIQKWKDLHKIDVMLEELIKNYREKFSVSHLIPEMVDSINELFNKPEFLNVPPKLMHQILLSATKQEKIKNHHALYNFLMNFINQDQQNRINLLNFINPNYLSQNEIEQFFESNLIPDDPYYLSQIPIFLTNLALLFREKYKNEQQKISSIGIDIQKQDSILDKKNKEYQSVKDQLTDLQQQQQQQQLSKKAKRPKHNPMVYVPESDNDRRPNNSQKQDNKFSYTPSNNSDSTMTTTPTSSNAPYNNRQERGGHRGGRGGRGGKSRGGSRPSSTQPTESSNPNLGVVTMSNEVPAPYQMQMPMQMPMMPQMPMGMQMQMNTQIPINMQMPMSQNMNVPLMSDAQIKELEDLQTQIQQQMQQLVNQKPLSHIQITELNNLTQKYQHIQFQLEQQKQKKNSMQSNYSISIQKNTKDSQISVQTPFQAPNAASPLGSPLNPPTSNPPPTSPGVVPIQVEKLVPNISIEKPKTKRTALDPEQKAKIAAAKKQASVKVERPTRGTSIEFGKTNNDQT